MEHLPQPNKLPTQDEVRVRSLERQVAVLETQMQPMLALAPAMTELSKQIGDLRTSLYTLKGQAITLGAIATIVAPTVCGIVLKLLTKS